MMKTKIPLYILLTMAWMTPVIYQNGFALIAFAEIQPLSPEEELEELQKEWKRVQNNPEEQQKLHSHANYVRMALCDAGENDHCTDTVAALRRALREREDEEERKRHAERAAVWAKATPQPEGAVDIDKLAYAVAVAETSNCTAGTALSRNNCHGIMQWNNGKRSPRTFASHEESFEAFKELWLSKYCNCFPTVELARKYSGGTGHTWLKRVQYAYYHH